MTGSMAGSPMRTRPSRHSWKMSVPRPVMNRPLMSAGTARGSRSSASAQGRPLVEQEVLLVGRGGEDPDERWGPPCGSPIFTSARMDSSLALLARDLIGSGFSAASISLSTAAVAFISPSTAAAMMARSNSSSL